MDSVLARALIEDPTEDGRLPLFLLFLAFLATFLITRTITRLIRAGKGPFRDRVAGGVHIHHAIPGIVLTIAGAFTSVAVDGSSPGAEIAAVLIGIGASLVLDEFALLLRLQDVYWEREGQLSVQVVSLTIAGLGLMAIGIDPLSDHTLSVGHLVIAINLPFHVAGVLMCVAKGKYSTASVGAFIPPVAWIGAIRLARPHSAWAKRHYSSEKRERAADRAHRFDDRYGRWGLNIEDLVAGKPTASPAVSGQEPSDPKGAA
ncbi:hypothetical protein [Gordonia soli]|uniref:Integral membrane protein n=1 Tax=Gordonia soli NBRC 108243 TaxID=1223545 RepID=M0QFB3_9ACTN|nr:hypothetical protein [Gordonia soli]GAC66991.1 hypothetical protein GS4_05_02040 [Gordonia soli NBRC 108243]